MFYSIVDTINEMNKDLMSNGIVLAKKPSVTKTKDGVLVEIDYIDNGEVWTYETEITA